jgi:membrane fusion protein (multidrug efflux system)
VALEQAEAALAQTVRQVRTLYANNGSLAAQIALRQADVARRRATCARQDDLQPPPRAAGATAPCREEELNHAARSWHRQAARSPPRRPAWSPRANSWRATRR